ncbi:Sodium/hydrogen exchanger 2 [Turnera subulata]|uniref:Sodium/hydrogen exchanger 2 n=1 Tax=Turnera subulata TaxID=218843 RepID=A0A9Q0F0R7_9ROSI|nr:Sodium/hydrogen exchanger 2 [Turnera subulata]
MAAFEILSPTPASQLKVSSTSLSTSTIIALCVFFTLLCACIIIGHLLEENRWANESITALLLGLAAGVVILLITEGKNSQLLVFDETLFFLYLLPPIIFNAGYLFLPAFLTA